MSKVISLQGKDAVVFGKPVEIADGGMEIPVKLSDEMKATVSALQDRIMEKVSHIEGLKQAVVMYLLTVMGKQVNKRQMKRISRIVQQDVIADVVTREFFLYEHHGVTRKMAEFDTVTPLSGQFELRFKSGLALNEKQVADIEKILNYEHKANA